MRQVKDTDERGGSTAALGAIASVLHTADSAKELARRIGASQGQGRMTSELTLGLLHRLNNVMTSIYFTAEGCETEVEPDNPVREMLAELTRAVRDAQQLINQTSEVNLTLGSIDPEYHDLNALVRKELFLVKMLLPKNAVVEIETLADPALIRMSIADFRRVLFGIALNARDAAGVNPRVILQTQEPVQVNADEYVPQLPAGNTDMVALVFKDNGHGMTPDALVSAFSPLFTTRTDHMGLGLFHAQEIAQRNGGQIAIRRTAPEGAELVWFMPRFAA